MSFWSPSRQCHPPIALLGTLSEPDGQGHSCLQIRSLTLESAEGEFRKGGQEHMSETDAHLRWGLLPQAPRALQTVRERQAGSLLKQSLGCNS